MTVECENCKTRFHVADARIPAKGARVRCSRCHHRFHITPSYTPPKPQKASAQGSAPEPVLGGEAAREEDQLDNPEFLFDKPEDSDAGTGLPARSGRQDPREAETQLDQPALAQPPEPKPPPPPPEPRVVASGGMTAQELLDDGEPELSTGRFDIDSALGEPDSVIGAREEAVSSATARALLGRDLEDTGESLAPPAPPPAASKPSASSKLTTSSIPSGASRPEVPLKPVAAAKPGAPSKPAFSELADIAAELGEDEDSSFADWDPLATPSALASPPLGATAVGAARTTKLFPDPPPAQAAARTRRGTALDAPAFDPEAAGPAATILRVAAMLVGLALFGAAGRLLWLQRASELAPPQIVQAAGWVAADLETFLARSASGERVVVVRGNLFPEGAAPPPAVEVRLLGADDQPLVDAKQTWLERIDDAEVAPDRLGLRLAAAGGEIGAIGQLVTGFTAVIPDPPLGVRRVEVSLRARERLPDGTATAVTPEPPSAEPQTETASPTPAALPGAPETGDVVPAAPEPE